MEKRETQKNIMAFVVKVSLLSIVIFLGSGCASVTRGTTDVLEVKTSPPGALVNVTRTDKKFSSEELKKNTLTEDSRKSEPENCILEAFTPAAFKLKRNGNYFVKIEKAGFKPVSVKVTHKTSGQGGAGMAGNVLVGGVIGVLVDAGSGATQDLVPNPIDISLEPSE
jgi:hypothetical protein